MRPILAHKSARKFELVSVLEKWWPILAHSIVSMFGLCIDLKKWGPILAHYFLSGKVDGCSLRKMFDFMLRCKCEGVTDVNSKRLQISIHSSDV
jgi:hypothetical protein